MKDSTIANNAATAAGSTAAGLGAGASNISSALVPRLTQQLNNPQGYSQQDIGSMLSSGLAGSGGATAGLTGAAGKMGMTERNPNGFSAALDSAARTAGKTNAGISEGITAQNAGVKQQQQSQAGSLLSSLYGTDVSGQNNAAGQVAKDAQIGNSMNGLNTTMGVLGQLSGDASKFINPIGPCWIAATVYDGWLDPRTIKVRDWIFGTFRATKRGKLITDMYIKYGEHTASLIQRYPVLRNPFRKLFDLALKRANGTL